MGGSRFWLAACAAATLALGCGCDEEDSRASHGAPETVVEFFGALENGLKSGDGPYHTTVSFTTRENGQSVLRTTVEAWVDLAGEQARWEFRKDPSNPSDIASETVNVFSGGASYLLNRDGDGERPSRLANSDLRLCVPEAPSYLLAAIACGFLPMDMTGWSASVEQSSFDGRPTVALLLAKESLPPAYPTDIPPPPGGWPTPLPAVSAAKRAEVRFHLDQTNYLPVAITQSLDSDPQMASLGGTMRFEGSFIDWSKLPADAFSPQALGYISPDKEEQSKLERPDLQTPVYWLGRTFDPGGGLPVLGDLYVNSYGPRPSRGDEPNIQLSLAYTGVGGLVRLDIFPPGDWEAFKTRLGGNFPWTWCSETREFEIPGATVSVLSGYESFPYNDDFAQPGHLRPGETPPPLESPAIPPKKTEPCPTTAQDRFMAEVRFRDATVVIDGTLKFGGQDGSAFGVFDNALALEAVARGLRLRQPGE